MLSIKNNAISKKMLSYYITLNFELIKANLPVNQKRFLRKHPSEHLLVQIQQQKH